MSYQRYLQQLQDADNNAANLQNLVNEEFEEKKAEIGEKARMGEDIIEGVLGFEVFKNLKKGIDAYRKSKKALRERQNQENQNDEQDREGLEDDDEEDVPVEEDDIGQPIGDFEQITEADLPPDVGDVAQWADEIGDYDPDVIGEGLMGGTAQQRLLDEDPEAHLDLTDDPMQPAPEAQPPAEVQPAPEEDPPVDDPADVGGDLPEHPSIFTDEGHQQALDEINQHRANRRARFEDNAEQQAGEGGEEAGEQVGEQVGEDVGEDLGEELATDVGIGAVLGPVGEVAAVGFGIYQAFKSLFEESHVHKPKLPTQAGISLSATDVDIPTTAEI